MDDRAALGDQRALKDLVLIVGRELARLVEEEAGEGHQVAGVERRGVGGDAARIWLLARRGGGWANATYSVLIDRIAGVFVLALIVIVCLPWTMELIQDPLARAVLLLIGLGSVARGAVR